MNNNNQIPKTNLFPQNYYNLPYIQNNPYNFTSTQNQFPLSFINPNLNQNTNLHYSNILPLIYPDQFLYPSQPFILPSLFNTPASNQINALNQLLLYQTLLNENKTINNNCINEQKNNNINYINNVINKENQIENNIYNKNILDINEENNEKEKKDEKFNMNQMPKKFFIVHDNNKFEKKNLLNVNFEKNKIPENNNIDFNNKEIINKNYETENILKVNDRGLENKDIKENKGRLSLFTISNIKMNTNGLNTTNTNINNTLIKLDNNNNLSEKIEKSDNNIQMQLKEINKNIENEINYEINNKELFNLQQNDLKNDKIKYYRCSYKDCNKVFLKQSNLKDHIRTHTGEKPYICSHPGCGKTFSQHGNLKKHEKIHLGNKKYYCSYPNCGKKFSASYNLKIHYRCHTGEKPYKCNFPNCGRSFYDKGNLKYHEKNMHALENMEYPYSCEHMGCNAKFKTKLDKLKHHSEMEVDCFVERKELIKLIQRYKIFFRKIVQKKNIDVNKNEIVLKLKRNYEEIQNKLIDQELFNHYLGEDFDNECTNIEEIVNNNDENKNINNNENMVNNNEKNIKNDENKINDNEDLSNNNENVENEIKKYDNEVLSIEQNL